MTGGTTGTVEDSRDVEGLIARLGDSPLVLAEFARTYLLPKGHGARARALCDRAVALAPHDGAVRAICAEVRSAAVGSMLFAVARDEVRQAAYERAIRRAVRGGARVLDIGAGTGLFSMMAARAGASEVISCDRNEAIVATAQETVARNGFADRVTVLAKASDEISIGEDMAEAADVLIWDNTGSDLLALGTLPAIEDAARRLIKPGGQILPAKASIHAALADFERLSMWRMQSVCGFDLTPFNALAEPAIPLKHSETHLRIRSDATRLFEFGFSSGARFAPERVLREVTASGGTANGVVQWLEFQIDDEESYSAGPEAAYSAFNLIFRPAEQSCEATPGQTFAIGAAHDRKNLRVWLEGPK